MNIFVSIYLVVTLLSFFGYIMWVQYTVAWQGGLDKNKPKWKAIVTLTLLVIAMSVLWFLSIPYNLYRIYVTKLPFLV